MRYSYANAIQREASCRLISFQVIIQCCASGIAFYCDLIRVAIHFNCLNEHPLIQNFIITPESYFIRKFFNAYLFPNHHKQKLAAKKNIFYLLFNLFRLQTSQLVLKNPAPQPNVVQCPQTFYWKIGTIATLTAREELNKQIKPLFNYSNDVPLPVSYHAQNSTRNQKLRPYVKEFKALFSSQLNLNRSGPICFCDIGALLSFLRV